MKMGSEIIPQAERYRGSEPKPAPLIGIQNKPLVLPGERETSGANKKEGEL